MRATCSFTTSSSPRIHSSSRAFAAYATSAAENSVRVSFREKELRKKITITTNERVIEKIIGVKERTHVLQTLIQLAPHLQRHIFKAIIQSRMESKTVVCCRAMKSLPWWVIRSRGFGLCVVIQNIGLIYSSTASIAASIRDIQNSACFHTTTRSDTEAIEARMTVECIPHSLRPANWDSSLWIRSPCNTQHSSSD